MVLVVSASTAISMVLVVGVLVVVCPRLGAYMAQVFGSGPAPGDRWLLPVERRVVRLLGARDERPQSWSAYACSVMALTVVSLAGLYAMLRAQGALPFNPNGVPNMKPALALNTAVSFVTGTNWQAYSGESAASHLAQMSGLVVAQFLAGAVGIAVAVALVRGLTSTGRTIGNFWADLTRALTRVLLPIAVPVTLVLIGLGTIQNLRGNQTIGTVGGGSQMLPGGPVASQVVAKTLGTNGGGFFNANSAHPFDNPTAITNLIQLLLCLVIPFSLPFMLGRMAGDRRQGRPLLIVMAVLWAIPLSIGLFAEAGGNSALSTSSVDQSIGVDQSGGNMEGKEIRFGPGGSTLLTAGSMGTTAGIASSGIGSYTAAGQSSALVPILLGEVSPGGAGSGLVGMLVNVLLATFIAGLMIGRTPDYLGKRLGPPQLKLTMLATLVVPATVLVVAGIATVVADGTVSQSGVHGLTEILYASASATNGNGSAMGGLTVNGNWWLDSLAVAMLIGRFLVIVPVLALAGSFVTQPRRAVTTASLDTGSRPFTVLLLAVVVIVGGLTYLPSLTLTVIRSIAG
jgi:K+-transporting ATPase ATPase A chain